jgi:hypothetical protein
MTDANDALAQLFSQLLELHATYEDSGHIYHLPLDLPQTDAARLTNHARREGYSPGVFSAALKDLELVREKYTVEQIWLLLEGDFDPEGSNGERQEGGFLANKMSLIYNILRPKPK